MEEAILNFSKQFNFQPEIINSDKLKSYKHFVVGGMGGSHLSAGIIKMYQPGIELYVHRDYGVPPFDVDFCSNSLFIASSYSGNTEETIDFIEEAYSKGFDVAAITTGGKLLEFAKKNNIPYIQMPDDGIQPRMALGYAAISLAHMMDHKALIDDLKNIAQSINPESFRDEGQRLANELKGQVPIIYSSLHNLSVAYNWKIKMNETGKIPAFYNVFPELNHNEFNGFDVRDNTQDLSNNFHFIFLRDSDDYSRIQKRMDVTESIYQEKGLTVTSIFMKGNNVLEKIFSTLLLADWIAFHVATNNGVDPEQVPMVEDLKKQINQ
ncbi:bifunctional phosphoglucose/phosphomannose isomerase [Candidatus Nomurabacteria bacterium]|nr:bifunctional phosphoglucose/phosphomannose isomerase [Candidatus Nomurabacteria bacterium]